MRCPTLAVFVLFSACGGDNPAEPIPLPLITGTYIATIEMAGTMTYPDYSGPISCNGAPQLHLFQVKNTNDVTGSYGAPFVVCMPEVASYAFTLEWSGFIAGTRSGNSLSLHDPVCEYKGTISTTSNHVDGTITCKETNGAFSMNMTGKWHLTP